MLNTDDTYSGVCVLTNSRTGEVYRLAVQIATDATTDEIVYTGQTIDRTYRRTVRWLRSAAPCFLEMMGIVADVGRDRRIA